MAPIIDTESGPVFAGSVDEDASLTAAAAIARDCEAFSRDDDDECYVEGDEPTCFNCRARRWTPGGFSCTKGLLRG
jgi:hypothetical protein